MALDVTSEKLNSDSQSNSPLEEHKNNQDTCPVCSAPSLTSCRTCKKIGYCSRVHQRIHWKVHKIDCYPLLEQQDEILGRRLIATRNIKQGEIILRERPLVSGPKVIRYDKAKKTKQETDPSLLLLLEKSVGKETSSEDGNKSICLGCFHVVKSNYICSTCSWPICGPTCEENVEHKENECELFASHNVKPFAYLEPPNLEVFKYDAITVLRGVLLKEKDLTKWKKLIQLQIEMVKDDSQKFKKDGSSFFETFTCNGSPSSTNYPQELLQFCKLFIQNTCKLTQCTEEDVDLVLKVMRTFSIPVNNEDHNPTQDLWQSFGGLHLCARASFARQSCVPNSSLVIHSQAKWEIYLRALLPIQFGERITISYGNDVTEGIMARGKNLEKMLCHTCCTCKRCTDPTEMETYFSAIKCPSNHSSTGYLLPIIKYCRFETLGESCCITEWKCNECGEKVTSEIYEQLLHPIRIEWSSIICEQEEDSRDAVEELSEICMKYLDSTLHPNNFLVYKMEMEIVKRILNIINHNGWQSWENKLEDFVNQMIQICKKWLSVATILWPGYSKERGMLLFLLQEGMTIKLMMNITMNMRNRNKRSSTLKIEKSETELDLNTTKEEDSLEKDFNIILKTRQEVLEIFSLDPPESFGQALALAMVQSRPEIVIIKRHFSAIQNRLRA